jgi:hypothetical protein
VSDRRQTKLGEFRPLSDKLRTKGRRRREGLQRLAATAAAPNGGRNDLLPALELIYIPLDQLRPAPKRIRKLDPAHVRAIAGAIGELGFCDPILIGKENVILDGEARLEAAKLRGLDRIPCIQVGHLNDKEQRVLRLAVNRLAEKGEWDLDQLKIEFEELIVEEAPIEISGFAPDEIDQIINSDEAEAVEQGPLKPKEGAVAIARIGDVFQLGRHRLICGDATDPAVLRLLMDGDSAGRLILTDEPYNVPIAGHVTGGAHREFAMASGEMNGEQFLAFNLAWIEPALGYLCDGGIFGTFIDWRGYPTVHGCHQAWPRTPQSNHLGQDQCWHGKPLSLAARASSFVQEGQRRARE